jgi:hypothetical protein
MVWQRLPKRAMARTGPTLELDTLVAGEDDCAHSKIQIGGFLMKRFCVSVLSLVCLVALDRSCVAQANPWDGSWKADPSSLKYSGPTFSVATDADGFTTTRGGTANPKVVCDGKPQTTPDGMSTCKKSGMRYTIEVTKDGKKVRTVTISVSADGKTRTSKNEIFPTDDKPFTTTVTSERVSGGPGMAGVWKEVKVVESQDTGILAIKVTGDSVSFKETDRDKPVICKLDGTETKVGDLGSMSVKLADSHTLKVTYSSNGKVRRENTFVLSADGKMITETDVTPDPSPSTMTLMFHKS